MVSMGFVETTDRYEGVVSVCNHRDDGWFVVVSVSTGSAVDNYAFHGQPAPWTVGEPATVSVTTGADGKVSLSVARPV